MSLKQYLIETNASDYTDEKLLDEFEQAVAYQYDGQGIPKPKLRQEELRKEIIKRMSGLKSLLKARAGK